MLPLKSWTWALTRIRKRVCPTLKWITDISQTAVSWTGNVKLHFSNYIKRYYVLSIFVFFVGFPSALSIVPVKEEHNGQWNCLLVSVNGNKSKTVSVIVISEHTRYCSLAGNYLFREV